MKILSILFISSVLLHPNSGEGEASKNAIETDSAQKVAQESTKQKSGETGPKKQQISASDEEKSGDSRDPLENCTTTLKQHYPSKFYRTNRAIIQRNTTFEPKITYKVCLLYPDKGPCRANLNMFYFDPKYKKCRDFKWGGCQGNGNRFETEEECKDYCLSKRDTKRKPPSYCQLKFDYGYCFGATSRWFYDSVWSVCKETIYSGCGGNKNNFYSKEKCQDVCLFGKPPPRNSHDVSKLRYLIINPTDETTKRSRN